MLAALPSARKLAQQSAAAAETTLALPVFSPAEGAYEDDIQIEICPPQAASQMIFTLDGSLPVPDTGLVYTQPLKVRSDAPRVVILRARAVSTDGQLSPVVSASYFMAVPAQLPFLSLVMDPADLWDPQQGIYAKPQEKGLAWERAGDVTYLDADHRSGFHLPVGVRIHGGRSREFDKKSFRLYFRSVYGEGALEYPLFPESSMQSFESLVLHMGGQDSIAPTRDNWSLLRNPLMDHLAQDLGGYATHSRPVLLFINGEPWGIYYLRERPDLNFLASHYGIETADFLDSPEHTLVRTIEAGDRQHWDHLMQFLETRDLADPEAYAYIQSQIDVDAYIDYNLLHIYAANTDWPFHNVQLFRPRVQGGRWNWLFWDSDHAFAADPYSSLEANALDRALQDNYPLTGGRDTLLLRKLLENPTFRTRFLTRAADLLNTAFAPDAVTAHIDTLAAEIGPDIEYETLRWDTLNDWATNVAELRDFARLRPDIVRQQFIDRFALQGTTTLTFTAPISGQGSVALNGALLPDLPWSGTFFLDLPLTLTAAPAPGFRFTGWSDPDLPATPSLVLTPTTALTLTPLFAPLDADGPQPGDLTFTGLDRAGRTAWIGLRVQRASGVDLRGWRLTDNDSKIASDEGSLIFAQDPALAHVPQGTILHITLPTDGDCPPDQVALQARQLSLCPGNGLLDATQDPGFILGPQEALVLLAPGPTAALADDQGIAFFSDTNAVTPASFGVLTDGVQATLTAGDNATAAAPLPAAGQVLLIGSLAVLYWNVRQTYQHKL
jgi:hypothetical protein